ncbi:MAG: hypothetical protein K6F95_03855 [Selenomonas sp.]|uniref:hypothetical protein n=1 Tax=Selenomonas sp. TaxID=2053611 RepID=UPI0025F0E7A0|nr:hypothetical protein [Selenomonas sp.]MCR5757021.1 hypothetical protein [Selenomonas sp.]
MSKFWNHRILMLGMGIDAFKEYPNIDSWDIYHFCGKWDKRIFKLCEHFPIVSISHWYDEWNKKELRNYDTIIISDGIRNAEMIEYIKRKSPKSKIIIYYLNTYGENARNDPKFFKGDNIDIYTFDQQQAKNAGINFKNYFFSYEKECYDAQKNWNNNIEYDIFFVGRDKGRIEHIKDLRNKIKDMGLSAQIKIVPDKHKKYKNDELEFMSERIPYERIAESIMHSKAILDITEEGQSGITLRPMESLFFKRKLVTNNVYIKNYDLYDEENVFILGERDLSELPDFLDKAYLASENLISNFTKDYWLKSFFIN